MTQTRPYRIGIFDSGLGGLSVRAALRRRLPDASLLYVADSGFAPYGNRSEAYVRERSLHIAHFLIGQQVDALVIACNTATAAAAAPLRAELALPVIAMEPGLKPAIAASRNGVIAVLATQGTLASQQFLHLRERFAAGVRVIDLPCPGWVPLVEKGLHESAEARQLVAATLAPALDAGADTLVLGCTHFPFLRQAIQQAMPDACLIETAEAVAEQVARRLADLSPQAGTQEMRYWSSGDLTTGSHIMAQLAGEPVRLETLP
jgi:glutamate racemase